jgi:hypothetical protein
MLYYFYFLKKIIKSFIVNNRFKLPPTYLVVCILITFIKVHSCNNIFIKYYSHFSKSKPTFIHEDAPQALHYSQLLMEFTNSSTIIDYFLFSNIALS